MAPTDRSTYLHISRRGWVGLAVLLVLPWLAVIWMLLRPISPARALASLPLKAVAVSTPATQFTALPAGPWGQLECTRILIEPPSEFIPVTEEKLEPRWFFRGYTAEKLQALWQRAHLSAAQVNSLATTSQREAVPGGIVIHPQPATVISLSSESRAILYTALAEFAENVPQHEPFRLRAELATEWFDDSGLPPDIVALTRSLLYSRQSNVLFSDPEVVLPKLDSSAARVRFLKTLSRKSTILVRLTVNHASDPDALAAYWGKGRRSKDVRPLLQSLARHSGDSTLDLVHLLPPFPRALLYTYPLPSDQPAAAARDCHWTAFNFFREEPDDRFTDIEFVKQTLLNAYYPVAGEPTLGDVLVFVRPNGVVVHSCVYIAAEVVFTKNGSAFSVPWTFAPLDQVLAFYSVGGPVEVRRFRLKNS